HSFPTRRSSDLTRAVRRVGTVLALADERISARRIPEAGNPRPLREERTMNRGIQWKFVAAGVAATVAGAVAQSRSSGPSLTNVTAANPKAVGYAPTSQLSTELRQTMVAQGSMPLENPQGIIGWYGYENDTPSPDDAT